MAEEILKRCCCCKQEKSVSQFGADRSAKDLLKKQCKVCHNAGNAKYRKNNPETSRASCLNWQKNNPEKARAKRERFLARQPDGYMNEMARAYAKRYPERVKESMRKSREKNRVHFSIADRMRKWLKTKPYWTRTFDLLNYSVQDLKIHLEKQFLPGMNWKNYGSHWHIDHIRPLASFVVNGIDDPVILEAWCLTNLRPLWAMDNFKKSAKLLYLI